MCENHILSLITLYYNSLVSTIRKSRPELLLEKESSEPIPDRPPPGFFEKQADNIEDIGEPSLACFFIMSSINPGKWYYRPTQLE